MAEHGSGPVAGAPSAAQLTAAIERVSDGVLVLARDWTCTFINTAGGKLLGRAPEELIGGNIWQAFPEAVGSRFETSYQLALDTQKVVEFEEYFEPLNALFSIRTFPSPEGVTIYFTDVTELRRLAHERQATEEKLRQVAQQRRDLMDRLVVAQELERARIAADVHDDSVQALAAIDLRLGMLQRKVAESAPEFNELIRQLQTTLSGATDRLRQLLFDLEPTGVDDTLIDSLRDAAAHIFEDTAITWSFEGDLDAELHHTERGQAVRVAKEALTNVRKHAHASTVMVSVLRRPGAVEIAVTDDGAGLDPDTATSPRGHRGLATMRDRAEIAGGWCRLERAEPQGTTVRFSLPDAGPA